MHRRLKTTVPWEKRPADGHHVKTRSADEGSLKFATPQNFPIPQTVPFAKQLPRPDVTKTNPGAHEERFSTVVDVKSQAHTPNMSKALGRQDPFPLRATPDPEYRPNFKAVWAPISRDLRFTHFTSRKSLNTPSLDLVYANVEPSRPRISSPDFQRSIGRPADSQLPLPLFMRTLNSWQGVSTLNEKTMRLSGALSPVENWERGSFGGRTFSAEIVGAVGEGRVSTQKKPTHTRSHSSTYDLAATKSRLSV